MADVKYYDVILKPVITEKSMAAMAEKKILLSLFHPKQPNPRLKKLWKKCSKEPRLRA